MVAALALTSCTAADDAGRVTPTPSGVAVADSGATPAPTAGAAPAAARPSTPALAVPVRMDGPARTLAGLNTADTVVEYPRSRAGTAVVVLTREPAGVVGPLRAATAEDVAAARAWDAPVVTTIAPGAVRRSGAVMAEEGAPPGVVVRDPARRAPHNVYAVVEAARALTPGRDDDVDDAVGWATGPPPVAAGRPVDEVVVATGGSARVRWAYDPRRGAWIRGRGGRGAQATTQVDGVAVAVGTVMVAETSRGAGWQGAGPAVVLRSGRRHTARWVAESPDSPPTIEQADGTPFPTAGTVWLHRCVAPCAQQIAPLTRRPDATPR
jgi:hypothetical protein